MIGKKLISILFGIIILLSAGNIYAKEKRMLTLNEAIDIALRQSNTVKVFRQDVIASEGNYRFRMANYRPFANIAVRTPSFTESVRPIEIPGQLPVYDSRGNMEYDVSLDFNYVIPTNGTFTLSSSLNRFRNDVYVQDVRNEENKALTSLRLSFRQPIFTDNTLKEGLKSAEYRYERSVRNFNRGERDIIFNVTNAFFSLYRATRLVDIRQETMNNSLESYELAKLKFDAGIIPEVEALQLQLRKVQSEADYFEAKNALESEKDSFKQLIGLSLSEDVEVVADIEYKHFEIDLDKAIKEGLKNRSEININELSVELSKLSLKSVKRQREFKGDITMYYDFTGVSTVNSLNYSDLFTSALDDFRDRPPNRGVTLNFSYPILDWGRNSGRVQESLASLRESELNLENQKVTIEREIRDVVRNVREAENRLQILNIAQDVAQASYQISKERFDNGDITSQALAINQEDLTMTQNNYLNAFILYQRSVADLKRRTMWDFENNESYYKESYINQ